VRRTAGTAQKVLPAIHKPGDDGNGRVVVQTAAPVAASRSEEESIESYMDELRKRVRRDTQPRKTAPPAKSSKPAADSSQTSEEVVDAMPAEDEPCAEEPSNSSRRRSVPSERNMDMSAMRDLANAAARSAIDEHVRKNTSKEVTGKEAAGRLFTALLISAISVLLGYLAWRAVSLQAAAFAAIGGIAGAYWTLAALRRLLSALRLSRPRPNDA